jgi:hypothetical protein
MRVAHPCKERKDGAPFVEVVHTNITKGGPAPRDSPSAALRPTLAKIARMGHPFHDSASENQRWATRQRMTGTKSAVQISHTAVRLTATITLTYLGVGVITARYYPAYSHTLANSDPGKILTLWAIASSLLLPPYVGFEAWWMRKTNIARKDLWIDTALALGCFLFLWGIALYTWTHHAMF